MSELLNLATRVVARAKALGADEVAVAVSEGTNITIQRRGGKVEQATEATTRGLTVSVLADDRWSSNATSDLRPDALEAFLARAVGSTSYLEPEPERRLAPASVCGRGATPEQLDQDDPAWQTRTAPDRSAMAEQLEQTLRDRHADDVISSAVYVADGRSRTVMVLSNGFADEEFDAWFAAGGEMTLDEGDKRPESGAWYAARHLADLPSQTAIADEIVRRTRERLGAGPIASGTYPMLLPNHAAGRILGLIGGPISAGAVHQGGSCLADAIDTRLGSDLLTLIDDPTIPRGLGSRAFDGDGRVAKPFPVVEGGYLRNFYVSEYYHHKLGRPATTGGRSNWVIPPGAQSLRQLAAGLPAAIEVTGFLGGNSNGASGDFSLGIRGVLWENGSPTRSLAEMNISGNIKTLFHQLVGVANDPYTFSGVRSPGLLFDDVSFSGT